jgi:hypothetical protein
MPTSAAQSGFGVAHHCKVSVSRAKSHFERVRLTQYGGEQRHSSTGLAPGLSLFLDHRLGHENEYQVLWCRLKRGFMAGRSIFVRG